VQMWSDCSPSSTCRMKICFSMRPTKNSFISGGLRAFPPNPKRSQTLQFSRGHLGVECRVGVATTGYIHTAGARRRSQWR
jgi:hypothetical protein